MSLIYINVISKQITLDRKEKEPDLRYALLAIESNNHNLFSRHFECFIYEAREKRVRSRC